MNDFIPVMIATCGLGIMCIGLIVVGLFVLVRFTGSTILGNLGDLGFIGQFLDSGESDYKAPVVKRTRGQRPNFRERAQMVDFDSVVANKRQQNPPAIKGDAQGFRRPAPNSDEGFRPLGAPPSAPSVPPTPSTPASADKPSVDLGSNNYTGKYSSPRFGSRRRRDRNQDEIFGGMLDEDGDGDLDF